MHESEDHMVQSRRTWIAAAALATALASSGCGADAPSQTPGPEVPGGNAAPDTRVNSDVKVTAITLPYPTDGVYQTGADVELYMAISNTGTTDAVLSDVRSDAFDDVQISATADEGADGLTIPANEAVYVGSQGGPTITLLGLHESLRSSQSVPITLEFDQAGEVDVQAPVAAEGQDPRTAPPFVGPDLDSGGG